MFILKNQNNLTKSIEKIITVQIISTFVIFVSQYHKKGAREVAMENSAYL